MMEHASKQLFEPCSAMLSTRRTRRGFASSWLLVAQVLHPLSFFPKLFCSSARMSSSAEGRLGCSVSC